MEWTSRKASLNVVRPGKRWSLPAAVECLAGIHLQPFLQITKTELIQCRDRELFLCRTVGADQLSFCYTFQMTLTEKTDGLSTSRPTQDPSRDSSREPRKEAEYRWWTPGPEGVSSSRHPAHRCLA